MRTRYVVPLAIVFIAGVAGAQTPSSPNTAPAPGRTEIRLTYLGNAGWEITDGKTYVLTDPFITEFRNNREAKPGQVEPPPRPSLEEHSRPMRRESTRRSIAPITSSSRTGTPTTLLTRRILRKKPGR